MTTGVDLDFIDQGTIHLLLSYVQFFIRVAIAARRASSSETERILIDKIVTRIAVIVGDLSLIEYDATPLCSNTFPVANSYSASFTLPSIAAGNTHRKN